MGKFLVAVLGCLFMLNCFAKTDSRESKWASLSLNEQAEILYDLDIYSDDDLPQGVRIVDLLKDLNVDYNFTVEMINNEKYRAFAKKVLTTFENEVDREAIAQSYYNSFNEAYPIEFLLLVDVKGEVVAGNLRMFQDGRDENGEEADINWQAAIRFNNDGGLFLDENGHPYDDLYYEWSGH